LKSKKNKSLKDKILKYFILCSFGIAFFDSAVDSTFDDLLSPVLYPTEADYENYDFPHFVYIAVSLSLFFIGARIFYRLTAKALKEESERRVREQNLIYAAVTHDLRTPMTSVQGFAKALSDGKVKP